MFLLASRLRRGFSMTFGGHLMTFGIGFTQFFLNFNFVYRAELHITSGIVAVLFGLLVVPNALFWRIFFFFNVTAPTEIYTLSLHDALPISTNWKPVPRSPGTTFTFTSPNWPEPPDCFLWV